MTDEEENYEYFVRLSLWTFFEILLKENGLSMYDKNKLAKFLWEISSNPVFNWDKKCVIEKDWQHCWLAVHAFSSLHKNVAYSQCELLSDESVDENVSILKEELQFKSVTDSLKLNQDAIKELSHFHSRVCHWKLVRRLLPGISQQTLTALENDLQETPGLTLSLLNQLYCTAPAFDVTNGQFQSLSKHLVTTVLQRLKNYEERSIQDDDDEVVCDEDRYQMESTLLSMVSLADDLDCLSTLEEHSQLLCRLCEKGHISLARLLLAASAHSSLQLYIQLTETIARQRFRSVTCVKKQDCVTLSKIHDQLFNKDRKLNICEVFLRTIKNKTHWIEDVMGLYSQFLLSSEQWSAVDICIEHPLFVKLRPLLVFQIWNRTSVHKNNLHLICPVLDCCKNDDPVLNELYETLEWLRFVIEWVEKETNAPIPDINTLLLPAQRQSHLHLLKIMTDITLLDPDRIKEFLENASCKFNRLEDIKRETAVFDGFCILTTVLNLIVLEMETAKRESDFKEGHFGARNRKSDDLEKTLLEVRKKIDELEPLNLRLEVLENIFSLLFLRSEDLREELASDSGADDDERQHHVNEDEQIFPPRRYTMGGDKSVRKKLNTNVSSQSFPPRGKSITTSFIKPHSEQVRSISMPGPRITSAMDSFIEDEDQSNRSKICVLERGEGFLCSNRLVQELLVVIRDSVKEIDHLSDRDSNIQELTHRLSKAVDDGLWRLEILSGPSGNDYLSYTSQQSTEWIYLASEGSDSDPETLHFEKQSSSRRSKRSMESGEKSSESGSNNTGASSFGAFKVRKIRKRKTSRKLVIPVSCSLVKLMLASPRSLVAYFLARKDILKASAVIKRFKLEEAETAIEVNFVKTFGNLKEELIKVKEFSSTSVQHKDSAFKTINEAASAGVFAASVTSELERFWAMTPLPAVGENIDCRALVVLDLAMTLRASFSHSEMLLSIAAKHCPTYSEQGGIGGARLEQFVNGLNDKLREEKVKEPLPDILCSPDIGDLLYQPGKPIAHHMWSSLDAAVCSFTSSLNDSQSSCTVTNFSHLAQTLSNVIKFATKGSSDEKPSENYLHKLCAYVTSLSRITAPYIFADSPFALLSKSWTEIVHRLLFESNVDPEDLEQMMEQLGVDLICYIIQICTQLVPIVLPKQQPGIIIMNNTKPQKLHMRIDPSILVIQLLSKLISAMQSEGTDFGREEAKALITKPAIQDVLQETSQLSNIDVNALTEGNESLTFLINLENLMWIHALLMLETKDNGIGLLSKSSTLRDVSSSMVGYNVGGIGFISLGQIHSALIHNCLPPTCLSSMSSLLPISPTSDPRTIFALSNSFLLTPKLQVFDTTSIDHQLERCVTDYVKASVEVSDNSLLIPIILQLYLENARLTQRPESEDNVDTLSNVSREQMSFLSEFLKENPAFSEIDFTGKDIRVSEEIEFRICIDYTRNSLFNTKIKSIPPQPSDNSDQWKIQGIKESILKYLSSRSSLVGMLVQQIHSIDEAEETLGENSKCSQFEKELNSDRIQIVSCLFGDSPLIATLLTYPDAGSLWELLDATLQTSDWEKCLKLLSLLPENLFLTEPKLCKLKDYLLLKLATTRDGWQWCQSISDVELMAHGVLDNVQNWKTASGCTAALQTLISKSGLNAERTVLAKKMLSDITICQKVLQVCGAEDWHKIYRSDCWDTLNKLLDKNAVELALEWNSMQNIPSADDDSDSNYELIGKLIVMLLETGQVKAAIEMFEKIKTSVAMQIGEIVFSTVDLLASLRAVVNFLNKIPDLSLDMKDKYCMLEIGIDMLLTLPEHEQNLYRALVGHPILLVEQLLMCTQLSSLETALQAVECKLEALPPTSRISQASLDMLLRNYASRAVDISVRDYTKPNILIVPSKQVSKGIFVIPNVPPTKQEWVPDDEVSECMCCLETVFSMFNRRHHCRRCGRVICGTCSSKTMKVAGYGNVPVRTCDLCFDYATPKTSEVIDHGDGQDGRWLQGLSEEPEWTLTTDDWHNKLIRGEFIYEYAPSVSLCLSILQLHSLDTVQPRFLLGKSETMLALLRPAELGLVNPELDYALLVQMIRSLILGAKVCYSGLGLPSGMVRCDSLLGEVDILNLLVSAHYYHLLPPFALRSQPAIRNLRDSLLDHELWSLAIEVSTKAGLEYGSVWFAWGKTCLRAGNWPDAREKFSHCSLQKKDLQNSGMLADILQILQHGDGAVIVETRLARLKSFQSKKSNIIKGCSLDGHGSSEGFNNWEKINGTIKGSTADGHVFSECLYYLGKYGTHAQNLEFLVNNGEIAQVLEYVLKSKLEPDMFPEHVYLPCLRTGRVSMLHQAMIKSDPKLQQWKAYLRALCIWCEHRDALNILYQVQLWLSDYVRAAMTCIRFYYSSARSYRDLKTSVYHLHAAISHLQAAAKQDQLLFDPGITIKLEEEGLNKHTSTVELQVEVTAFITETSSGEETRPYTLFGNSEERTKLASSILSVGDDLKRSLSLTERIITAFQLPPKVVYCAAAKSLAKAEKVNYICQLQTELQQDVELCDEMLMAALQQKPQQPETLIGRLSELSLKVDAYIEFGLLKAAYLLAAKYNSLSDVRKVLSAAECLNQPLIKKICLKRLSAEDA